MAILILFNLWLGLAHESLPRDWQVMPVHKSVGLTVLADCPPGKG
jgi:cytochrome b561